MNQLSAQFDGFSVLFRLFLFVERFIYYFERYVDSKRFITLDNLHSMQNDCASFYQHFDATILHMDYETDW